jgi:aspartate carbamoyltransferase regulatory subunit
MERNIRVRKIKNGTVIDHITTGQALNVLKIIGITTGFPRATVTVAMNVPSRKAGAKDIVKVEGRELMADEVDKISLIAPHATINIIRDYKVVEKKKVSVPEIMGGFIRCANPNCITNTEYTASKFAVEEKHHPIKLRCIYCERTMSEEEIVKQF